MEPCLVHFYLTLIVVGHPLNGNGGRRVNDVSRIGAALCRSFRVRVFMIDDGAPLVLFAWNLPDDANVCHLVVICE